MRGGYVLPALSAAQLLYGETIRMSSRMTNHLVCIIIQRVALGANVSLDVAAPDAVQNVGHAHAFTTFLAKHLQLRLEVQ